MRSVNSLLGVTKTHDLDSHKTNQIPWLQSSHISPIRAQSAENCSLCWQKTRKVSLQMYSFAWRDYYLLERHQLGSLRGNSSMRLESTSPAGATASRRCASMDKLFRGKIPNESDGAGRDGFVSAVVVEYGKRFHSLPGANKLTISKIV